MATSDKADKAKNPKPAAAQDGGGGKAAARGTVVPSAPVKAGDAVTVSRIPPSQPIESTLLGKAEGGRPAAARKPDPVAEKPAQPDAAAARQTTIPAVKAAPAAKADTPPPRPAHAAELPRVVVKQTGFWPVALGGVVAAGLGAAAAIYAMPAIAPYLPAGWQVDAPQPDLDALRADAAAAGTEAATAQLAAARDEIVAAGAEAARQALSEGAPPDEVQLRAVVDEQVRAALAGAAVPPGQAASTAAPASDVTARLAALQTQIEAQAQQIAALNARPQLDPQAMQQVQALAQGAAQVKADIETAAQQARDSLTAVQTEADAAAQRAQAVASVALLGAALEGGNASPSEAVQQLEQAGVAVPAPLAQGDLPSLDQLQISFDAPARAALRESLKAASKTQGPLGAVGNFLRVQTGARSVEPREGSDPDAVLSRAGALVRQGDLTTALEELKGLPEPGQAAMADWVAQANAYLAASSALNDVAKSLN